MIIIIIMITNSYLAHFITIRNINALYRQILKQWTRYCVLLLDCIFSTPCHVCFGNMGLKLKHIQLYDRLSWDLIIRFKWSRRMSSLIWIPVLCVHELHDFVILELWVSIGDYLSIKRKGQLTFQFQQAACMELAGSTRDKYLVFTLCLFFLYGVRV